MTSESENHPILKSKEDETDAVKLTTERCIDLEVLLELGNIGAGHAATSLSEILQQPISIDVPKIDSLPTHMVPKFYKKHDSPTTALYMQLSGESECDILLLLEVGEAKKIATMMTMARSPEEVDPLIGASAIEEMTNILVGSFLGAVSDFTKIRLVPTPPERVVDSFDAIIDNFLVKQSLISDEAVVFETQFKRAQGTASCLLMMFPSRELQRALVEKSRQWISNESVKSGKPEIICPPKSAVNIPNCTENIDEAK
jgi:chemotaxis protein CheC